MEYWNAGKQWPCPTKKSLVFPLLQHSTTPSIPSSSTGFTLIEVVITFMIAALIIAATASALITILRSETTARRQVQAAASLRTLQTQLWLDAETNSLATNLPPDWVMESETVEQGEGTNRMVWTVWRIGPQARRSFSATLVTAEP